MCTWRSSDLGEMPTDVCSKVKKALDTTWAGLNSTRYVPKLCYDRSGVVSMVSDKCPMDL